jgi:hypothetical protein
MQLATGFGRRHRVDAVGERAQPVDTGLQRAVLGAQLGAELGELGRGRAISRPPRARRAMRIAATSMPSCTSAPATGVR